MVSVILLVGVDVVSVPLVVGDVVSLQRLATVFHTDGKEKNTGYANIIKCSVFHLVHLHESSMQLHQE